MAGGGVAAGAWPGVLPGPFASTAGMCGPLPHVWTQPRARTHAHSAGTRKGGAVLPGRVLLLFLGTCRPCGPRGAAFGCGGSLGAHHGECAGAGAEPQEAQGEGTGSRSSSFPRGGSSLLCWRRMFALGGGGCPIGHRELCYLLESPGSPGGLTVLGQHLWHTCWVLGPVLGGGDPGVQRHARGPVWARGHI